MTTTAAAAEDSAVERQIRENMNTLMMRERLSERRLADKVGIHRAALNRRMLGDVGFLYFEVRTIARFFDVTLDELEGQLPSYDEWRARRDSNPQPSDPESPRCYCLSHPHAPGCPAAPRLRLIHGGASPARPVKPTLTAERRPA